MMNFGMPKLDQMNLVLLLPMPPSLCVTGSYCILASLWREICERFPRCGERHQPVADEQEVKYCCDLEKGSALSFALIKDLVDEDLPSNLGGTSFHCPSLGLR